MCFIVQQENPNELTAEQDIICWKVLSIGRTPSTVISIYTYFHYNLKEHYKLNEPLIVQERSSGINVIEEGFHSYIASIDYRRIIMSIHGCKNLYKCIIPKGAKYYINTSFREYVSDQIVIQEQLLHLQNIIK